MPDPKPRKKTQEKTAAFLRETQESIDSFLHHPVIDLVDADDIEEAGLLMASQVWKVGRSEERQDGDGHGHQDAQAADPWLHSEG